MRKTAPQRNTGDCLLWTVPTAMKKLGLGRHSTMRIAEDANAVIRIGGRVGILPDKLEQYLKQAAE